ncbi:MAG TPA: FecR family protein [Verrucomicrobiae bacterium]|nr:FecR family protein [Verrucomicrobiae bacterium]
MKRFICFIGLLLLAVCVVMPSVALADASHARIVRLSLTQGDVRYARSFHDDPLAEGNATWEQAVLNLPLREGYVLATGNGRVEVEFESGAMAFLSGNTVLEFYDLSLHDGGRITRLVLRQGSASFYVSPASGDYFSVTGGDFTVEANGRTTFRIDNFDDGSTVKVERGNAAVLRKDKSTPLEKGQSLSVHAGDAGDTVIGSAAENDDFDHWVSGRVESEVAALNSSAQYVSPTYTAGFSDLYTFGSWFSMGGYGSCWRPFGAGLGWSPFSFGDWYLDPVFGWTFVGSAQWGWLPYHYGGWISSPTYGWCWNPVGFGYGYGRPLRWRPATAVWVHSGLKTGIVPLHPLDKNGKTPVNLGQGVYTVQGRGIGQPLALTGTDKWAVMKQAPRETFTGGGVASAAPPRVSRTMYVGNTTGRAATPVVGSSITYDPKEHRFVNVNNPPVRANGAIASNEVKTPTATMGKDLPPNARMNQPANTSSNPAVPRASLPSRPTVTPPPAHTSGGSSSRSSSGSSGGGAWGGGRGSGGSSGSSSSSSSGSHPSGGGGGGGHPR